MSRTCVIASLLLALVAGCSKSEPKKAEQSAPSPTVQPVSGLVPSPSQSPTPTPSATPTPSTKTAAKKHAKAEKQETGSPMDRFAKCLADKDAVMYGVFWCDHCREQKTAFGDSFKYVKYVECVTTDAPRVLLPECKAQGITHTPTWIFADGTKVEGAQSLATLAEKTGCKAP